MGLISEELARGMFAPSAGTRPARVRHASHITTIPALLSENKCLCL